jgi:hypothetical protein
MNETLREIAVKAQVEHCISHVRLEEFTELIVKKCMDIIVQNKKYASEHKWPATELANVCLYEIDKTFGVTEDGKETISG